MVKEVEKKFDKLSIGYITTFENYLVNVSLNREDSRIAKAITWLLDNQNKDGSWGRNNVACTSLVMIALHSIEQPAVLWGMSKSIISSFEKAEQFLAEKYKKNSYEKNVWDSAVACRALSLCGKKSSEIISDIEAFILSEYHNTTITRPHYLAQMILTFKTIGANRSIINEASAALYNILADNDFNYTPYILGQCLDAIDTHIEKEKLSPIEDKLIHCINHAVLDSANFINICSALIALKPLMSIEKQDEFKISIFSIFGGNCFRDDGTWYHDEMCTAYALIALTKYEKEILISIPRNELHWGVYRFVSSVKNLFTGSLKKVWLLHILNTFICGGLITFYITYTSLQEHVSDWVNALFPVLALSSFTFTLQFAVRAFKK